MNQWLERLEEDGAAIVPGVIQATEVARLIELVEPALAGSNQPGNRRLHECSEVRELAISAPLAEIAALALGGEAKVVRVLWFDKTAQANWGIPLHQDVTIAVRRRVETDGYRAWSVKDGMVHVQPPTWVLEKTLAVRLHLDDCPTGNGPLEIIPGSHRHGRLTKDQIPPIVADSSSIVLGAKAGDAVVMRSLTLHASASATVGRHRRVLHIEYSSAKLDERLQWLLGWPLGSKPPGAVG